MNCQQATKILNVKFSLGTLLLFMLWLVIPSEKPHNSVNFNEPRVNIDLLFVSELALNCAFFRPHYSTLFIAVVANSPRANLFL